MKTNRNLKQYHANGLPSLSNVSEIPIYIVIENVPGVGDMYDAAQEAIENWNDLEGINVSFDEIFSYTSTGINIINFNDSYNTEALKDSLPDCLCCSGWRSQFPRGDGLTGHFVRQTASSQSSSYNQLVHTVMHELGHILGTIHTDWPSEERWPVDDNDCTPIDSTLNLSLCSTTNDPNSIFDSDPYATTTSFTFNDKEMLRYLYPDYYATPTISNISVGPNDETTRTLRFSMTYNDATRKPLKIKIQRMTPYSSTVLQEDVKSCSGLIDTFNIISPTGTWRFIVVATNYSGEYTISSNYYTKTVS